jgi:alpha-1,3-mannosyltransferase
MWTKAWEVVHLCRVAPPQLGGMEAMIGALAERQREHGLRPRIVTLGAPSESSWRGVPVIRLPRIGPRRYPIAWGLGAALRGADLVHVHGVDGLADQALSWRRAGGPLVGVSTHGGYFHTTRQRRIKALWLRTVTRWSLARADALWFTSDEDAELFKPAELGGEVVPDGVDLARYAGLPRTPEAGHWLVLGRIDAHKGHADLLRTLAALRQRDARPWQLDVVGACDDPSLARALRGLCASLGLDGQVRWRGPLPDDAVRSLVARAELALFPSLAEGFGLALVELMAAGVVPVARPIPAHRARLGEGAGFLVEFGDAERAARSLSELRTAPLEGVGRAAARRAAQWGWDAVWPRWELAYRQVGLT